MGFLFYIVTIYIIFLLFRFVATNQELNFNAVGAFISKLTTPVFKVLHIESNKKIRIAVPIIIIILICLFSFTASLGSETLSDDFFFHINDFLVFFAVFFALSVILGNFAGANIENLYISYFYRFGSRFVNATRKIVKINNFRIIYPTILFIFIIYLIVSVGNLTLGAIVNNHFSNTDIIPILLVSLHELILGIVTFLNILGWLIIIDALSSWLMPLSSDGAILQLLYTVTEPFIAFFRRIIPNLGFIDISPLIALIVIEAFSSILYRVSMYIL